MYVECIVTIGAAATQVNAGLATGKQTAGDPSSQDVPLRTIIFQADTANTHAMFIGPSSSVSSTDWGIFIPTPTANVPDRPIVIEAPGGGGPLRFSDFWVNGTQGEKLHASGIAF